jgi:sucrose phosphorylase
MSDDQLLPHLVFLYGEERGAAAHTRLRALMDAYRPRLPRPGTRSAGLALSERDAILITYGDQVHTPGEPPLRTLADFCTRHLRGIVSGVHILPFYPYSSDDGFSVIDYTAVDPALGTWDDVARLGRTFRLMFDAVVNHISAQGAWFQGFLQGDPAYADFFISVEGEPDLSQVVRPRALPLLTSVETAHGARRVWTTFSADQVDLNFANPEVLLRLTEVLLFYVAQGAELLRLDAIAYLWKEIGTPSIHQPQTHRVIQLWRAVLDTIAPQVLLITETNVPHADNIRYFGDGANEAQMVYNFALPPLTLHALHSGSARALADWAAGLERPSARTTFFNFLASHDGVGVNPARGLLPPEAIDALVQQVQAHGGLVSYKHNPDGSQSPYELNVNYFDALSDPAGVEPVARQAARFLAAQSIMLALAGVPGIYFHSLFGSRGWRAGVAQTGRNRTINREKLDRAALEAELARPGRRREVFEGYTRLLRARASTPAFHPLGGQRVLDCGEAVFGLQRWSPEGGAHAVCLHNVSGEPQTVELALKALSWDTPRLASLFDGRPISADNTGRVLVALPGYGVAWLAPAPAAG